MQCVMPVTERCVGARCDVVGVVASALPIGTDGIAKPLLCWAVGRSAGAAVAGFAERRPARFRRLRLLGDELGRLRRSKPRVIVHDSVDCGNCSFGCRLAAPVVRHSLECVAAGAAAGRVLVQAARCCWLLGTASKGCGLLVQLLLASRSDGCHAGTTRRPAEPDTWHARRRLSVAMHARLSFDGAP